MAGADQHVTIGDVTLKNPVMTASGTFGYGLEYEGFFDISQLGGICAKGLSLHPRAGNPPPRIRETAAGMLNAIGLANIGVEAFCSDKLPRLRELGATVIPNIFASSVEDFVALATRLNCEDGIAAIEVNISCPNVSKGGLEFGVDPAAAASVVSALRKVTKRAIWVKLSPEAGRLANVAKACEHAGADALCAINTIRGLSIDVETWRPHLANRTGGLSGPAIKPIAVRMVWELSRAVKIPVIGIGGIATAEDAIEFMLAGACAVQVGSASFRDPLAAIKVAQGLKAYCERKGLSASALTGKAMLE
ncbi:MAG: dihydroorotate dehydrogenase [Polyangiaceae bacterium]|jgi:dihydroorotate dehydrogenase (NAD+) catalytic subunit|nr:dihydroorotate dehydrogenase [Polyangiaceae bacterium]